MKERQINGPFRNVEENSCMGNYERELGGGLRDLARRTERGVIEGGLALDHVHMLISIPLNHRRVAHGF